MSSMVSVKYWGGERAQKARNSKYHVFKWKRSDYFIFIFIFVNLSPVSAILRILKNRLLYLYVT